MTPKALVRSLADADVKQMVGEVLVWRSSGALPVNSALSRLADRLLAETGFNEHDLQQAESLVMTEAAARFAAQ